MRLNEDMVDLFEVHDAGLVADGFDECAEAQVAGAAQQAFAGAHDVKGSTHRLVHFVIGRIGQGH